MMKHNLKANSFLSQAVKESSLGENQVKIRYHLFEKNLVSRQSDHPLEGGMTQT